MPRIRTIKPEFWTSEQIVDCSTNARLLFIGMWNFCDDAGIHPASCKQLKMKVFPGDDYTLGDIALWIKELLKNNLIIEYNIEEKQYWQVTGWYHQKIEKRSFKYPKPPNSQEFGDHSTTAPLVVGDDPPADRIGEYRIGGDSNINAHYKKCALKFYLNYPIKKNKEVALMIFIQLCKAERFSEKQVSDFVSKCLFAVQNQKHEKTLLAKNGLTVADWKYPDNWLLLKCWAEDIETAAEIKCRATKEGKRKPTPEDHFDESIQTSEVSDAVPFT